MDHQGVRHNKGKIRYDLEPPFAQQEYIKVLTKGAEKYAERNWEKGLSWMQVYSSLRRHLEAFKQGEDLDPESGLHHMAHVMCNAAFILEYYKIYPQGDDRPKYRYKIGIDIDEVLADYVSHYMKKYNIKNRPSFWNFDSEMKTRMNDLKNDKDFWLSIPVKTNPDDIPFEPTCYITSRPIETHKYTEEWLIKNGFAAAPLYTVGCGNSKVQTAKDANLDWFIDDSYKNFMELNDAGICCFLFDAPHNKKYNVGHRRIDSLTKLMLH